MLVSYEVNCPRDEVGNVLILGKEGLKISTRGTSKLVDQTQTDNDMVTKERDKQLYRKHRK